MHMLNVKEVIFICAVAFMLLGGCSSSPNNLASNELLSTEHFSNHQQYQIESPDEIYKLSQVGRDFVNKTTRMHNSDAKKLTALIDALFDRSKLSIIYLAHANTTAEQTFENGMANCLSLTIMVYAMAEHIGLNASFKEVNIPEFWTRQGGNTLINGHINLQVEPQQNHQTFLFNVSPVVVDFDPLQSSHRFSSQVISKDKVTSYFYTNKAADAMISKNYDLAFAYLKAALNVYPNNEGALLNLGVLFRRNNMMVEAEASYREVLLANSSNIVALDNLGLLYRKTGRVALADAIEIRLKRKRHDNPYYHIMLGDIALEDKKLEQAIRHYKDSIDLNEQNHEVYFKLAKAYFALGDTDNTKRYLQSAKKRVKGMPFESRYASKLAILAQR